MAKRKLNIELLKQVRDKIMSTPDAYDQMVYGRPDHTAPCGTACCIAGWACVLGGKLSIEEIRRANPSDDKNYEIINTISDIAQELLGLDEEEAETLFAIEPEGEWDYYDDVREGGWPEPFASQWGGGREDYNVIAARYLDRIIETGEVL